MWTLAFGHHEDRTPTHGDARGRDGGVCQEVAAGSRRTRVRSMTRGWSKGGEGWPIPPP
jgi:hypothetical protein